MRRILQHEDDDDEVEDDEVEDDDVYLQLLCTKVLGLVKCRRTLFVCAVRHWKVWATAQLFNHSIWRGTIRLSKSCSLRC